MGLACLGYWEASVYNPEQAVQYAHQHWIWTIASGHASQATLGKRIETRRQVPAPGWFQPNFQCAEFVGRSLAAAGIPIPLVGAHNPGWPTLVNVDCQIYFMLSHGYATVENQTQVRAGDVALFRYNRLGQAASPTYWSHIALVVNVHPLLLDAHNAAHKDTPWRVLAQGTLDTAFLHIHAKSHCGQVPWHPRQDSLVIVHYRNIGSLNGQFTLYRNQVYRVASANPWGQLTLCGIPGQYWQVGFYPLRPSPPILRGPIRAQRLDWPSRKDIQPILLYGRFPIYGMTPHGRLLLAGVGLPIPTWTGRARLLETLNPSTHSPWHKISPQAVTLFSPHLVYLLPSEGSPILAKAWSGTVTVLDAICRTNHQYWGQVEWSGAHLGIGYIPLHDLRPTRANLTTGPLSLSTPNGAVLIGPDTTLADRHGHFAYAGQWVNPVS